MSREAWGDPPDPEPVCCPNCGEQTHTEGCEVCALDMRRISAEGEAMRLRAQVAELMQAVERLRPGHERYEVVRRMNVAAFRDAYILSRRTGKPFDEIIAEQAPHYGLKTPL